jgi:LysR family cyn operon transcriptional activator
LKVELRHLRYFIRAAELLHFTRAAESLYISQPSLSVHIQQLEEELNAKLFARGARNVRLTEAGQVFLKHAMRAVQELEVAGKEIDAMTGLLRGTLTLATVPLYGSKILPAWIGAFSLMHPDVHVRVRATLAEEIEVGLLAGIYDLGFSLAPPEHTELNTHELVADQIVIAVSRHHPLAKKEKLLPSDLNAVPMALPSHKISSMRLIGTYFEAIQISPNVVIEQDDGNALLELVKLGGFITFLPRLAIKDDPELHLLTLPAPGMAISFAAMWTQLNPAAAAFLAIASKSADA